MYSILDVSAVAGSIKFSVSTLAAIAALDAVVVTSAIAVAFRYLNLMIFDFGASEWPDT
jgi:hypothetical protein